MQKSIQFRGGFVLESVYNWLKEGFNENQSEKDKFDGLMNQLTSFEVTSDLHISDDKRSNNSTLNVLHNMVIRGMPTWISWETEKEFADKFELLTPYDPQKKLGSCGFSFKGNNLFLDLFRRALHIIEPRINQQIFLNNLYYTFSINLPYRQANFILISNAIYGDIY